MLEDDPITVILAHHAGHLVLCNSMETIADSLPDKVDLAICGTVIDALAERVDRHHRFEEQVLFPLLRRRAASDTGLIASLDRLGEEHHIDEGHAGEVMDLLGAIRRGSLDISPDAAGYMLRGLFESMRRHIAFENDHILPAARRLLTKADLVELRVALALGDFASLDRPPVNRG